MSAADEYRVQRLRTRAQWESGLAFRLSLGDAGIALFPSPAFHGWLPAGARGGRVTAMAVDECGQLLWTECRSARERPRGGRCTLWLYNRVTDTSERLGSLDSACDAGDAGFDPVRLWIDDVAVWVLDAGAGRILGFARETLQLLHEIHLHSPIDAAYAGEGRFVVLEEVRGRVQLTRYEARGRRGPAAQPSRCLDADGAPVWARPVGVAVSGAWAWVLDAGPTRPDDPERLRYPADCGPRFVRVPLDFDTPRGPCDPRERCEIIPIPRRRDDGCEAIPGQGLDPDLVLPDRERCGIGAPRIVADRAGSLYVLFADRLDRPRLVQFDPAGSLLGEIRLPARPGRAGGAEAPRRVEAMAAGAGGELLLLTDVGLALFTLEHVSVGASGDYYLRTLDNGVEEGSWHRVALRAELPRGTRLEIRAYASDQHVLRDSVNTALDDPARLPHQKRAHLESLLGPLWETVAAIDGEGDTGPDPAARAGSAVNLNQDALFLRARGRYLWLKLSLFSFDEASRPAVRELQVVHPRDSYLRYLPATFQEVPGDPSQDTPERDFLMRFLSLFETPMRALELEIDAIPELFDPAATPAGFLPWLAG
ncbi:MAG TPA: hypothetical protein VEQ60_02310, partial [Longimicrobium sp.]|nr:hypothetical protein [Longimicrobium sp.]